MKQFSDEIAITIPTKLIVGSRKNVSASISKIFTPYTYTAIFIQ
jgi:hypothetical protein